MTKIKARNKEDMLSWRKFLKAGGENALLQDLRAFHPAEHNLNEIFERSVPQIFRRSHKITRIPQRNPQEIEYRDMRWEVVQKLDACVYHYFRSVVSKLPPRLGKLLPHLKVEGAYHAHNVTYPITIVHTYVSNLLSGFDGWWGGGSLEWEAASWHVAFRRNTTSTHIGLLNIPYYDCIIPLKTDQIIQARFDVVSGYTTRQRHLMNIENFELDEVSPQARVAPAFDSFSQFCEPFRDLWGINDNIVNQMLRKKTEGIEPSLDSLDTIVLEHVF